MNWTLIAVNALAGELPVPPLFDGLLVSGCLRNRCGTGPVAVPHLRFGLPFSGVHTTEETEQHGMRKYAISICGTLLAFAVATAVQPKVLIVDEALSVGDEAFQRKCFRRIEQMRESGTSVLFVSHSTQAVVQLCDRVLWLDD